MPRRRPRPAAPPGVPRRDRGGHDPRRHAARRDPLAVRLRADLPVHARHTSTSGTSRDGPTGRPRGRRRRRCSTRCSTPRRIALARPRRRRPGRGPAPGRRPSAADGRRDGRDRSAASATSPRASSPARCSASSSELRGQGRAVDDRAGRDRPSPSRWIGAEEAGRSMRSAFGRIELGRPGRRLATDRPPLPPDPRPGRPRRPDRALSDRPGAGDRPARALGRGGRLVRLEPDEDDAPRWADRRNLDEVRRLSIALRRRESVAVLPEVFADFVARRQHVHPETRLEGPAAVDLVLEQLQGFAAPAELWESELLPRRVRDYRPAWLDEVLADGRLDSGGPRATGGASPRRLRPARLRRVLAASEEDDAEPDGDRGAGPRPSDSTRGAASRPTSPA